MASDVVGLETDRVAEAVREEDLVDVMLHQGVDLAPHDAELGQARHHVARTGFVQVGVERAGRDALDRRLLGVTARRC